MSLLKSPKPPTHRELRGGVHRLPCFGFPRNQSGKGRRLPRRSSAQRLNVSPGAAWSVAVGQFGHCSIWRNAGAKPLPGNAIRKTSGAGPCTRQRWRVTQASPCSHDRCLLRPEAVSRPTMGRPPMLRRLARADTSCTWRLSACWYRLAAAGRRGGWPAGLYSTGECDVARRWFDSHPAQRSALPHGFATFLREVWRIGRNHLRIVEPQPS